MDAILCADPTHAERYYFIDREVVPGDEMLVDWLCSGRLFVDDRGDEHFAFCDAEPTRFPDDEPAWTDGTF